MMLMLQELMVIQLICKSDTNDRRAMFEIIKRK